MLLRLGNVLKSLLDCPQLLCKTKFLLLTRLVTNVVDVGAPADWVKINVRETVRIFLQNS